MLCFALSASTVDVLFMYCNIPSHPRTLSGDIDLRWVYLKRKDLPIRAYDAVMHNSTLSGSGYACATGKLWPFIESVSDEPS